MYREKFDLMLGSAATAFGTSGAALQWWGQVGSLLLVGLNVILACAGLYLIWLRIRRARLELEKVSRER